MSTTIDEKVVEMRFDNKQFESNVATSMSTLDKLKKSLKFDGASKGLEDINSAAKRVDMNALGSAVESVKAKFSALDVMAITALSNITNSAVNTGKQLIKSLSVDQLYSGWQKFSDKTTSVATLQAQGYALEEINSQLGLLNWFTDETSYNFTDMVANISKFTATGKGLTESVNAMEGIATWAALSGQNATKASSAMYQLSQALSAGFMRKEDWKSIQNVSMDTDEFRQKTLDAAVALKTLQDNGDGTYTSLINKSKEATDFTKSQFVESLTTGAWFTSDVMMKVFGEYSSAVGSIYKITEEKGMLASEVIDEIHDKADELKTDAMSDSEAIDAAIRKLGYTLDDGTLIFDSFGLKAFEAGQKARTFQDAIDSVKDAVSTKWMSTFELIFGDAEKATELWTDLANTLYDVFAAGGDTRNTILEFALSFAKPWETIEEKLSGIKKITDKVKTVTDAVGDATDKLEYYQDVVTKVWRGDFNNVGDNPDRFDLLTKAGYDPQVVQDLVNKGYQYKLTIDDVKESYKKFGLTLETTAEETEKTTDAVNEASEAYTKLSDEQLEQAGLTEDEISLYRALEKEADRLKISVNDLTEEMSKNDGRTLLIDSFKNIGNTILEVGDAIKEAWSEIFNVPSIGEIAVKLYGAIKSLNEFSKKLRLVDEDTGEFNKTGQKIVRTFKGIVAIVDVLSTIFGGGLRIALKLASSVLSYFKLDILDVTAAIGDALVNFDNWFKSIFDISGVLDAVVPAIDKVVKKVKKWFEAFKKLPWVSKTIEAFKENFGGLGTTIEVVDEKTGKVTKRLKTLADLPGIKKALNWLSEAFSKIGKAITWLSEAFSKIGKVIWSVVAAIKNWFKTFKDTEAVQKLVTVVNDLVSAFSKLFNGSIDINEFARNLGKNLGKLLASLPKIAIQLAKDFVAGFQNGIVDKVSGVIKTIVEFCGNLISSFASALGIASPSKLTYAIGVFLIAGFVNGIKDSYGEVFGVFQPIVDFIVNIFSSLWGYVTDEAGAIQWDKIFSGGITISSLVILNKFADAFGKIANSLGSFTGILSAVSGTLKKFGKLLDSMGWDFKAKAVLKIAASVAILAAAVLILAQIEDPKKLWNAVGAIGALTVVLVGLMFAMKLLSSASLSWSKEGGAKIDGIKSGLIQLGIVILLVALAVKMISDIPQEKAEQGFKGLAGIAAGMLVFLAIMGLISKYAKDISGIGKTMTKLAFAMILMVAVCKLIGMLSTKEIGKGIAFIFAFMIFVTMLETASYFANENVSKIGNMVLKISLALALMVGVCKLISILSMDDMKKGAAFVGAFLLFTLALMGIALLGGDKKLASISDLVLSVSVSLLAMALICKIVSKIPVSDLIKGGAVVLAFTAILGLMIAIIGLATKELILKVASTVIAMSTAIGVMAAVAVVLGMVDLNDLAKGVTMVSILAAMMALMVNGLRGANEVKGSILAMAATIAIMAGVIVGLSLIDDTESVMVATACMALLMGMFRVMTDGLKSINLSKTSIAALGILAATIIIFGGIIAILASITDPLGAISAAGSLAVLMLAMSVVLKIINGMDVDSKATLKKILVLSAMALPLWLFANTLASMNGVEASISNVLALTILMGAMTGLLAIINYINVDIKDALIGIVALAAMTGPLAAFIAMLSWMSGIENAMSNAKTLIIFMTAMTALLGVLALVGAIVIGTGGVAAGAIAIGIVALAAMTGPLAAFIAMFSWMSGIENATDNAMVLIDFMTVMTDLLIKISSVAPLAVIGVAAMDSLVLLLAAVGVMATAIGWLVDKCPDIQTFLDKGIPVLEQLAEGIGTMIGNFIGGIGAGLSNGLVKIGDNISEFMDKLSEASGKASNIKGESFDGVKQLIVVMAEIGALSVGTGITDWWSRLFNFGQDSMDKFQNDGVAFFNAMKAIGEASSGVTINADNMGAIIDVAEELVRLQSSLEPIGGLITWLTGRDDLGTFGINAAAFVGSMKWAILAAGNSELNTAGLDSIITAAENLVTLRSSLEPIGGLITWFTGRDDLGAFGINAAEFVGSMRLAFLAADAGELNTDAMKAITDAATALSTLQSSLEPIGGVITWLTGRDDLNRFGINAAAFVGAMRLAFAELGNATLNTTAMEAIIKAATELSTLQSSLDRIGGVITFYVGRNDLGRFGINIVAFIGSMKLAFDALADVEGFNEDAMQDIIDAATALSTLQSSLEPIGGVVTWFTGRDDLGVFGLNVGAFIDSMVTALSKLNGTTLDSDALGSVVTAAIELAKLQSSLEPMGGVVSWFTGQTDLGTFGINIGLFALAMAKLKEGMGQNGITKDCITSITNAGNALIALQKALPEEHLFDGKMNLSDFSRRIYDFSIAMGTFGSAASEIDSTAVSMVVDTAYRIKSLIESLVNLDTSGLQTFTGIGTGGFGADGAAYEIAQTITKFGETVAYINTDKVSTAVWAAQQLKTLINDLATIDNRGIELFTPENIGSAIKRYSDNVGSIDTAIVASSITSADRLRSFIASLVDLNTSGIGNFKIDSIGTSLNAYWNSIANVSDSKILTSVSSAESLRKFIADLSELNTSGVEPFKTAVSELNGVNVDAFIKAFSDSTSKLNSIGADIIKGLTSGIKSETAILNRTTSSVMSSVSDAIKAKTSAVMNAGKSLIMALADGIRSGRIGARHAASDIAIAAKDKIREKYDSFYNAGAYLVDGFALGIRENVPKVEASAIAMTDALDESVRNTLGIHSPATRGIFYGGSVDAGVGKGLVDNAYKAEDGAEKMSNGVVDTIKNSFSGSNGIVKVEDLFDTDTSTISSKVSDFGSWLGKQLGIDNGSTTLDVDLNTTNVYDDVTKIQQALKDLGYFAADVDGIFGPITQDAVNAFLTSSDTVEKLKEAGTSVSEIITQVDIDKQQKSLEEHNKKLETTVGLFKSLISGDYAKQSESTMQAITDEYNKDIPKIPSWMYDQGVISGENLGNGFVSGTNSKAQDAYNAGFALSRQGVRGVNDGQDSHSPSKETIKSGKWLGEGLIIGIKYMGQAVYNTGEELGTKAVNATRSAMTSILDSLNSNIDAQPTIRPVIDLTDVQTGANALNGMFNGVQTIGVRSNLNAINSAINAKLQNGSNDDVISAIDKLRNGLETNRGDVYNFGDFTYDDGDNISDAVRTLVRAAKMGRRV